MAEPTLIESVQLSVQFSPREPKVYVDSRSNIWYASYWDHHLTKMDPQGKKLWSIKGPGVSPYELQKPISFALVNEENQVLILHKTAQLTLFDAASGEFIREIPDFRPYARLYPWNKGQVIALTAPYPVNRPGLALLELETGEVKQAWFQFDQRPKAINVSSLALAVRNDGTIYYQPGALPEVHEIGWARRRPNTWPLKPPAGYVQPPDKPIPERDRYSREKVDAYYNAFTKVKRFQLWKDRFLLVCWQEPGEGNYAYQLYDLEKREIVGERIPIQGLLVQSADGRVYGLERIDSDDPDTVSADRLHRYRLKLP